MKEETAEMAKSQKRSTREVRQPKAATAKASPALTAPSAFPVNSLMQKPKGKL
jgi:hypothetical protein